MFGMMLPSSSLKLRLSKMSMLGIGDRMMRHIMKTRGSTRSNLYASKLSIAAWNS